MTWPADLYHWLMARRRAVIAVLGRDSFHIRTATRAQHDYDDEQRKLDEVWRRIAKAGHGYLDDRTLQARKFPK